MTKRLRAIEIILSVTAIVLFLGREIGVSSSRLLSLAGVLCMGLVPIVQVFRLRSTNSAYGGKGYLIASGVIIAMTLLMMLDVVW